MKKKRTIKEVQDEINLLSKKHGKSYGIRKIKSYMPLLMTPTELQSLSHLIWLEGYLRAMRDERGLK